MPSLFPSAALRRAAPPLPPARSRVSPQTLQATRVAVQDLLQQTQAFNALPEDKRRELANGLVQIGTYLAEPDGNHHPGLRSFLAGLRTELRRVPTLPHRRGHRIAPGDSDAGR